MHSILSAETNVVVAQQDFDILAIKKEEKIKMNRTSKINFSVEEARDFQKISKIFCGFWKKLLWILQWTLDFVFPQNTQEYPEKRT